MSNSSIFAIGARRRCFNIDISPATFLPVPFTTGSSTVSLVFTLDRQRKGDLFISIDVRTWICYEIVDERPSMRRSSVKRIGANRKKK
jgi:hypothetical protein